ncbi:hypothetical protein LINPERPRIM_LOCUS1597 [Linum perenne]
MSMTRQLGTSLSSPQLGFTGLSLSLLLRLMNQQQQQQLQVVLLELHQKVLLLRRLNIKYGEATDSIDDISVSSQEC